MAVTPLRPGGMFVWPCASEPRSLGDGGDEGGKVSDPVHGTGTPLVIPR
jgi:hypothetical protein